MRLQKCMVLVTVFKALEMAFTQLKSKNENKLFHDMPNEVLLPF